MKYRIRQKVLSLHGVYNIYDETGEECYFIKQNAVSATNKTHLYDQDENELALIHRKMVSMHETHYIEMSSGETAELSEKKMLQIHDNYEVEGFGWTVSGDITGHEFTITDAAGQVLAESQQKWISVGDVVAVEVYDGSQTAKIMAVLITLLLIHRDRIKTAETNNMNQ